MTVNEKESTQVKPMSLYLSLESALGVANWIAASDIAAVTLARRIATMLDVCFDTGDIKEVPQNAAKYLQVLQQLHLTVDTRIAGKQGEENDGNEHVGEYLRLISTKNREQISKPTKRRATSK